VLESLRGAEGATLGLLVVGLAVAFGFEFVNGFRDTANAVATVIYTRSPRPGARGASAAG
jgi:phosphate/sulfate permease